MSNVTHPSHYNSGKGDELERLKAFVREVLDHTNEYAGVAGNLELHKAASRVQSTAVAQLTDWKARADTYSQEDDNHDRTNADDLKRAEEYATHAVQCTCKGSHFSQVKNDAYLAGTLAERERLGDLEARLEKAEAELKERQIRSDVWMKSDYQCREYAHSLQSQLTTLRAAAVEAEGALSAMVDLVHETFTDEELTALVIAKDPWMDRAPTMPLVLAQRIALTRLRKALGEK